MKDNFKIGKLMILRIQIVSDTVKAEEILHVINSRVVEQSGKPAFFGVLSH
jgi:hypothetical protein